MRFFVFAEEAEFLGWNFEFPVIAAAFAVLQELVLPYGQKLKK